MQVETKNKDDTSTGIAADSVTDIDVTGFSFTPDAVLNVAAYGWPAAGNEYDGVGVSLFGGTQESYHSVIEIMIIKATPGTNKVTVRLRNTHNTACYYRMTCTAAKK